MGLTRCTINNRWTQIEFWFAKIVEMVLDPADTFAPIKRLSLIRQGKHSFRQTHLGFNRPDDIMRNLCNAQAVT